jgi:hypothetical protein
MPIDPSIAMGVRPVQLDNPMDAAGKAMTLRHLALQGQMQEAQLADANRKLQEQAMLADIYRRNTGPDGTVNHAGVIQGMGDSGVGHLIPAYRKTMLDADKDQSQIDNQRSEVRSRDYKMTLDRMNAVNAALDSLRSNPNVTHQDVINTVVGMVNQGAMDFKQGQAIVADLPPHPSLLPGYLQQKGLQVADAKTRLEMLAPKFHSVDNGGSIVMGTTNPLTGQFTQNGAMKKVVTPGEALQAQTTRRGQDLTYETANNAVEQTPTGVVVVNKAKKTSAPVIATDGTQTQQVKSPLVENAGRYQSMKTAIAQAKTLIPQATASGIGAVVDKGMALGGQATPGADAAAQLETIGGWMTSNVPRMEGPQSDADAKLYKQMAAQVGDRTVPASARLKALESLETLQEKYADQNGVKKYLATKPGGPARPPLSAFYGK